MLWQARGTKPRWLHYSQYRQFMHHLAARGLASALVTTVLLSGISHAGTLTGLGFHPDAQESGQSSGTGISDDGQVVVGWTRSDASRSDAFRWTPAGGLQLLDDGGGVTSSFAFGVSADGSTVVGTRDDNPFGDYGVIWSAAGVATPLFPFGQAENGLATRSAYSLSADGTVVAGFAYSAQSSPPWDGNEVFRWTAAGGPAGLGVLPGASQYRSRGGFVSADGETIVGGSLSTNGFEAFRWTSTTGITGLGDLAGGQFFSEALGISPDGGTVVGLATDGNGQQATRWTAEAGLVGLGNLPTAGDCAAVDAAAKGAVIVGYCTAVGDDLTAFIWTPAAGMEALLDHLAANGTSGLDGWSRLTTALGISADGQWLVGTGINAQGLSEGFRVQLSPVPAPPAFWLLVSGVADLGLRRFRSRQAGAAPAPPPPGPSPAVPG